jgi:hypothetical protein
MRCDLRGFDAVRRFDFGTPLNFRLCEIIFVNKKRIPAMAATALGQATPEIDAK